jgi:broad specificity phosphatase PhoE
LSELGRRQAEAAAESLRALGKFDVVSSPMLRCRQTAAPYARWRGLAPAIEPRVSEIVADDDVEDRVAWLQARFPWREPGPSRLWNSLEPRLRDWRETMLSFIRSIDSDTAVFTHFIGINVICGAALRREETIVCRPDHASITELEVETGALRFLRHGASMQVDDVR